MKILNPKISLVLLGMLGCFGYTGAQDLHFSQFMNNPLLTNPANTGFNPDYDFRVGGSYRNQWWSLPAPYKTVSLWGDIQINRESIPNGWLGLGGVLLNDVAGDGGLTSTKMYGSIAYHQELGEAHLLSAGFNVGFASKRIDIQNFRWENQWTGKFFDSNVPSGESFAFSQIGYLDIQAGLNYAYFPNENVYFNAGVSLMHLNTPRESFFSEDVSDNRVPMRTTAFANMAIKASEQWIISPNVYYSNQAGASELVGGLMAQYNLSGGGETQVLGGAYMRAGDAAIGMVGVEWNATRLTFSYDATMSNVKNFNGGNGAIEFSLIKFGAFSTRTPRQSRCPSF
ncbi:MAG: PorP/SprF family type IX secretion system membrane protein [Chitinophagaceae bacterium]|nr:PorP/SprF family type IX secretion system membrane protein [Chitinophagaceae bacterium]